MFTLVLVALFIMTLVLWEHNGNVSHDGKLWFNAIATILNLALGLNFLEAFKDMAKILRWRILANRPFTVREADLILGGESLIKLATLMWESRRKLRLVFGCLFWIALNLLAQATIAMLSLNYSMDSGRDSSGIYTTSGNVSAARLDCFYEGKRCPVVDGSPMTTAHTYGELLRDQECCPYTNDADIKNANQSCPYFCNPNIREFAYRFSEYNPTDLALAYPYATYRNIRASADQCYKYKVDFGKSPVVDGPDGNKDVQDFTFGNESYTAHLPIPKSDGALDGTTYVYNGSLVPQNATEQACGPRCIIIYAYRIPSRDSFHQTTITSCHITISEVYNATEDWHHVPDDIARLAAASIGLTGRPTMSKGNIVWPQYQLYTFGSYWETGTLEAPEIGARIASFALSSLASLVNINPKQIVKGTQPNLGYHLEVQWQFVIALAACIGVAHCLLVAAMLWIAKPVVVLDDSDLSTARLLHGLVGTLDGRGSLSDGKALAEGIQSASGSSRGKVVYGVGHRGNGGGERILEMREGLRVRKDLPGKKFPEGRYA